MIGAVEFGIVLLVVAGLVAYSLEDAEPKSEIEVARQRYVEGEIDLDQFERRAELILDERAQRIRDVVEVVGGVGPATSASLAQEFDDVDEIRRASVEELSERVHGVGPSTAEAIDDALDEPSEVRRD